MQVWIAGQFIPVEVGDRQEAWNASAFPVQIGQRMEQVPVSADVVARAVQSGHERDLYVLVGRAAAQAATVQRGSLVPVNDVDLQALWTRAGQGQFEKTAAACLHLLLAAKHRQRQLDVLSLAASLQRSVWEVMSALRILHDYGAAFVEGGTPEPSDQSLGAARAAVRLATDVPDVARLVAFAEALARTTDGIRGP